MRAILCAAGLVLALSASAASACGHCVEDKVAAVYDYAVVTQAQTQRHHVAFFAIDGKIVADESLKRTIESAVRATDGVDKDSVRVSLELAALSFSFDPKRASFASVQKSLEKKLASRKLLLMELKFMDASTPVKTVARQ